MRRKDEYATKDLEAEIRHLLEEHSEQDIRDALDTIVANWKKP